MVARTMDRPCALVLAAACSILLAGCAEAPAVPWQRLDLALLTHYIDRLTEKMSDRHHHPRPRHG
jgi:hypothetical protein